MKETVIEEEKILIAERQPPGDNWELVIDQGTTIEGLVMALTMYMRKTKFKGSYQLDPLDGKLYAIVLIPNGAMGVTLKLKTPSNCSYADSL